MAAAFDRATVPEINLAPSAGSGPARVDDLRFATEPRKGLRVVRQVIEAPLAGPVRLASCLKAVLTHMSLQAHDLSVRAASCRSNVPTGCSAVAHTCSVDPLTHLCVVLSGGPG